MPARAKEPAGEPAHQHTSHLPAIEATFPCYRGQARSHSVRQALDYLLRNYSAPVRICDLAALSGQTPYQLIRAFRKELGITPHALLIRIRVLRATALLELGEPIAGVAVEVGFVDQTHFTRHFKRIHGRTPGRFIKLQLSAFPSVPLRKDRAGQPDAAPGDR